MRVGTLAFFLPLLLYAATRAPDLTFIDSGELAAAATTLGIAHPTGYPLYTLVGRTLCVPPAPLAPIARLTLFSVMCGAAGAAFAAAAACRVAVTAGLSREAAACGGLAAGLLLAAGITVWEQSTIVEVYALHLALVTILVYLAVRIAGAAAGTRDQRPRDRETGLDATATRRPGTDLLLFAYVAGLAIGNHLSTLLLLPALVFLIIRAHGAGGFRGAWPALALAFAGGLSVYIYLPVRSARDPLLDWGDPENLGAFYRHATGAVYRVWFLSGTQVAVKQLLRFIELLTSEMTPLALVPAAAGVVLLWHRARPIAEATALLFLLNLLYAINYDIHDIDSYFLPAFLVLALWAGFGIALACETIVLPHTKRPGPAPAPRRLAAAIAAAFILPFVATAWNFRIADQRDNHFVPDYTAAMFASLEPRAVILSKQWDLFCSASIYEQLVRGTRRDVTLLEKELLRRRWYLKQLGRWDPGLVADCREVMAEFDTALIPFEAKQPYDADRLQELYVETINCLLGTALGTRPTYLTPDALEPGIARDLTLVPVGLAMRLYHEPPAVPPPDPTPPPLMRVRNLAAAFSSGDPLREQFAGLVLEMSTRRAIYFYATGRTAAAFEQLNLVLTEVPEYANAVRLHEAMRMDQAQKSGAAPPAAGPCPGGPGGSPPNGRRPPLS